MYVDSVCRSFYCHPFKGYYYWFTVIECFSAPWDQSPSKHLCISKGIPFILHVGVSAKLVLVISRSNRNPLWQKYLCWKNYTEEQREKEHTTETLWLSVVNYSICFILLPTKSKATELKYYVALIFTFFVGSLEQ